MDCCGSLGADPVHGPWSVSRVVAYCRTIVLNCLENQSRTIVLNCLEKIKAEQLSSIVPPAGLLSKVKNDRETSTGHLLVTDSKRLTTFHEQLGQWFYFGMEELVPPLAT